MATTPEEFGVLFLRALPVESHNDLLDGAAIGAELERVLVDCRKEWPEIVCPPELFLPYLAVRVRLEGPLGDALGALHLSDLYLACACQSGDDTAVASFSEYLGETMVAALHNMRDIGGLADEVLQRVREKLFVGGASPAKIATYFGRGPLRSWVRAAVVREAISYLRSGKREILGADAFVQGLPSLDDDPVMQHLKRLYRDSFKVAFEAAFSDLSAKDRTLLRYKYCDATTLDDIALVYRVHRATAARWLAKIREDLLLGTRARMKDELKVSDGELDSIIGVIQSRLDVSIANGLAGY